MTPNQTKSANKRVRAHFADKLTPEIERLITLATYDLHFGPIGPTADDGNPWPGFERACELISSAIEPSELWVDLEGDWIGETEPRWENPEDPESDGFMSEDFVHFECSDVKRAIFGTELAGYV